MSLWEKIFPTFEGGHPGKKTARTMIEAVGGPDTIRTRITENKTDGSTTRLKTRNGHPEFVTTKPKEDFEYVEKDYLLRVYHLTLTFVMFFMKSTELLRNMELRVPATPVNDLPGNAYFYDKESKTFPVDGLGTGQGFYLRKPKKASIHFFSDGSDNDAVFPQTGQTYFSHDHTVGQEPYGGYVARVTPISTTPMTIRGGNKTLYFKEPTHTITYLGINNFDQVVCFGVPWHGFYSPGKFTFTNGHEEATGSLYDEPLYPPCSTYLNFNMPAAPAPTAEETAAGMTWENDILLCGYYKNYTGTGVNINPAVCVFRSTDGSVHFMTFEWSGLGPTGYRLYCSTNSFYVINALDCPDLGAGVVFEDIPYAAQTFPINFGSPYGEFVRQSPNGSKCLVVPFPSTSFSQRTMVEVTFSGGNGGAYPTATTRFVTEWFDAIGESLFGDSYNFDPKPFEFVEGTLDPVAWSWRWHTLQRAPISIGYTKNNLLYMETWERERFSQATGTPIAMPWLGEYTSDDGETNRFTTYVWDEDTEILSAVNIEDVWSITGYKTQNLRRYTFSVVPGYESLGLLIYYGPTPATWVPKSPTYDATYAEYPSYGRVITPGTETGNQYHLTPLRIANTMTVTVRYVFATADYVVEGAWAFGQEVPNSVGHHYANNNSAVQNTAYNIRTQEIMYGANLGWA